ncbi:alpha-galactosidase [Leifsonia sp. AG29]|uniref:alpha-galactosidase n=1 Tax=Leifsonia sp. AG29 TaxID=2598860 RepID=UPI00131C6B7C|nr:alpha-galactosidase [Leifsonia sp. AG29]
MRRSDQHAGTAPAPDTVHLRNGGTSLILEARDTGLPGIVYWGAELAAADAAAVALAARPQRVSGGLDRTPQLSLLATDATGWSATPGIAGHRPDGRGFDLLFSTTAMEARGSSVTVNGADTEAGISVTVELEVTDAGLLKQRATLHNTAETPFVLDDLLLAFPVPTDTAEILDTTGHHLRERFPQRRDFTYGTHLRESRRGRPGADSTLLLAAGVRAFGFERGLVHAIHVAWSGNHRVLAERTTTGDSFLAGGELLLPGEGTLAAGGAYTTPWVIGSWGDGLDELSGRFHRELRSRPGHPSRPRPVTLNTWEAVYFDHDLSRLIELAEAGASVGVERYVLDDGWFSGRRGDTAGLGDWFVDTTVWPDGLHPIVDRVHELGMEFGLWVEPEMVNLDSDLAREHPDWLLRGRNDLPVAGRQQYVLDLANPDAYAYIEQRLEALLQEYDIAYLKWDHNRDVTEPGDGPGGRARVHDGVLALYRLLASLKERHPGLEIETCASGGARVDLGILEHTDRIWTSDCLDPLERLTIQKYTGLVVPPELMGAHLTSPVVHSTGRTVSLELSAGVALFGHFGIEWDLTRLDRPALDRIAAWVERYKEVRELIAAGRPLHSDVADPALDVRGVVAPDGARALVTITQVTSSASHPVAPVRIPGLDPERVYAVSVLAPENRQDRPGQSPLPWEHEPLELSGLALATAGLRPPVLFPQGLVLLSLDAVG